MPFPIASKASSRMLTLRRFLFVGIRLTTEAQDFCSPATKLNQPRPSRYEIRDCICMCTQRLDFRLGRIILLEVGDLFEKPEPLLCGRSVQFPGERSSRYRRITLKSKETSLYQHQGQVIFGCLPPRTRWTPKHGCPISEPLSTQRLP
jgi:hypothetical protein